MNKLFTLIGLLGCLSFAGCTNDFEELNTNPNAPVDVQSELLLRQVIFDYADGMSFEGFTGGANLGQYFSADPGFNAFDRGNLLAPQFGGSPWPLLYGNLRDIELVLQKSRTQPNAAVYEGPALVLKALIAANITDIFGNAPYTDAVQADQGIVAPAYTEQEAIYTANGGILDNLDKAVEVMSSYTGVTQLQGDELYAGDLTRWIRLANSLQLKYLIRISDRLNDSQLAKIQDIISGDMYISTAQHDAVFRFSSAPNDFRFARARLGDFTNYVMSNTLDGIVDATNDPRETLWFRANSDGAYQGVPHGLPAGFDVSQASIPGLVWRENATDLKANFMTSWETHFILAEAALKGVASVEPSIMYETGVRQAFAYWNVALPNDFLTRQGVAFNDLEQIATQRWLASIGNGYEGWIQWRRTGFPTFGAPVSSLNDGLTPIRFPYPANEQALNQENFDVAVSAIGGINSPNVPVWWDMN